MKLFFLPNEHLDYVIMAESEDEAWEKLKRKLGILRPDAEEYEEDGELYQPAYHDLREVTADDKGENNPNDLRFVL